MPTFSNLPPADNGRSGYRLLRTPPAHALTGHVISDNLQGCKTHFVGNRTIPCEAPDCDACNSGIAWRWHGYVAIVIEATQEIAIFECTARASAAFSAFHQRHGTLRGCYFKASRLNQRPNGRVMIQTRPADLSRINLPKTLPVHKCLCHIWNIPESQVSQAESKPRPPFEDTRIDRTQPAVPIPVHQPGDVAHAVELARLRNRNNRPPATADSRHDP